MSNKSSGILISFLTIIIIVLIFYSYSLRQKNISIFNVLDNSISTSTKNTDISIQPDTSKQTQDQYSDAKTYVFDNFHGNKNVDIKFKFLYPNSWVNDGQYFSPQNISYYDMFSSDAPVYFDLVKVDTYEQTELKYQIDKSKRKSPDSVGKIDGKDFKRYDLIDYGTYGGDSAGRVIIYFGPKIKVDSTYYYLVFHWEERPLSTYVPGNNPEIYERIVNSLKFL